MKRRLSFVLLCLFYMPLMAQVQVQEPQDPPKPQPEPRILNIDISYLDEIKTQGSDTLYVINFWATWCKPCVEELPYFEQLREAFPGQKLKIILVNNDSRKTRETKLEDFLNKKKIESKVVWMQMSNPDLWINSIDEGWSGAIPATLMLKNNIGFRWFKEGEVTYEELLQLTTQIINQ